MSWHRLVPVLALAIAACETGSEAGTLDAGGEGAATDAGAFNDGGKLDANTDPDADLPDLNLDAALADATSSADAPNVACPGDAREPDDTLSEAEEHDPIHGIVPVELAGLTACPGDRDLVWAGFVDPGGKAGAVLTWDASLGHLELSLGDADNMPIAHRDVSTASAGHAEELVNEYYDSYFYVRVRNPGSAVIPYTLTVTAQVFGP